MTSVEIITLAVWRLAGGHGLEAAVPEASIIVESWTLDRERFGLRGFKSSYPDSKRVVCDLCRKKQYNSGGQLRGGVLALGLLERIRPLTYRLTQKGLQLAESLIAKGSAA